MNRSDIIVLEIITKGSSMRSILSVIVALVLSLSVFETPTASALPPDTPSQSDGTSE